MEARRTANDAFLAIDLAAVDLARLARRLRTRYGWRRVSHGGGIRLMPAGLGNC